MSPKVDSPFHVPYTVLADNILLAEMGTETLVDRFGADNTAENMSAYLAASFSPEIQGRELAAAASRFLIIEHDGTARGYTKLSFGGAPDSVVGQWMILETMLARNGSGSGSARSSSRPVSVK
jgi:hypothetical protein